MTARGLASKKPPNVNEGSTQDYRCSLEEKGNRKRVGVASLFLQGFRQERPEGVLHIIHCCPADLTIPNVALKHLIVNWGREMANQIGNGIVPSAPADLYLATFFGRLLSVALERFTDLYVLIRSLWRLLTFTVIPAASGVSIASSKSCSLLWRLWWDGSL